MFDFVYYPVSAILWFWHKVFGAVLGPDNGFAWVLAVVFLVFTLRLVLLRPAITQIRTARLMQRLQPDIAAVQQKYAGDRQRQATRGWPPISTRAPRWRGRVRKPPRTPRPRSCGS